MEAAPKPMAKPAYVLGNIVKNTGTDVELCKNG